MNDSSLFVYTLQSGPQSGWLNMATDEALLDWVRTQPEPTWILRTYQWEVPTLSYGVHQSEASRQRSLESYLNNLALHKRPQAWSQRPTGGRTILHGDDISFSVLTNASYGIGNNLTESYDRITTILEGALTELNIPFTGSTETDGRSYTTSALCFETHTPHDVLRPDGHKMAGCAQLRRQGGVLQHGAVFFSHDVTEPQFLTALCHSFLNSNAVKDTTTVKLADAAETLLSRDDYTAMKHPLKEIYSNTLSGSVDKA